MEENFFNSNKKTRPYIIQNGRERHFSEGAGNNRNETFIQNSQELDDRLSVYIGNVTRLHTLHLAPSRRELLSITLMHCSSPFPGWLILHFLVLGHSRVRRPGGATPPPVDPRRASGFPLSDVTVLCAFARTAPPHFAALNFKTYLQIARALLKWAWCIIQRLMYYNVCHNETRTKVTRPIWWRLFP